MKTLPATAAAAFAALASTAASATTPIQPTPVTFASSEAGVRLSGNLYRPRIGMPRATFVIIGPMTYQMGQAPTQYAQRLASQGYAALVFDVRGRGASGGAIRALESPTQKIADFNSAVRFVRNQANLTSLPVIALGICQGSSYVVQNVADNPDISAGVTIAGHYRDRAGDIAWLTQAGYDARLARGDAAAAHYASTGEVDYVRAADPVDMNVGMPGGFVYDWYGAWAARGEWENRYAIMSDAELLRYESLTAASRINKPYLMIHSDNSFLPDAARRHFAAMPSTQKTLLWEGETPHLAYYDNDAVLDRTVTQILRWAQTIQ